MTPEDLLSRDESVHLVSKIKRALSHHVLTDRYTEHHGSTSTRFSG